MFFWNISNPVTVVVLFLPYQQVLQCHQHLLVLSILPVATVPRPVIENTSSIAIKNGFQFHELLECESTLSINSKILSTHGSSPFLTVGFAVTAWNASNADPAINGISSPG
jgi:hypothetical protein